MFRWSANLNKTASATRAFLILMMGFFLSRGRALEVSPLKVNQRTLNCFLQIKLLNLSSDPAIGFEIDYNSFAGEVSMFGRHWTFGPNAYVREEGPCLLVIESDAFEERYFLERTSEEAREAEVQYLVQERQRVDAATGGLEPPSIYEAYRSRVYSDGELRKTDLKALYKGISPKAGTYHAFGRGTSTLQKHPDGHYSRVRSDGSTETFDDKGRLVKRMNSTGDGLELTYEASCLARLENLQGMHISFGCDPKTGLCSFLRDSQGRRRATFTYTAEGMLEFVRDEGDELRFSYDSVGNLLSLTVNGRTQTLTYTSDYDVESLSSGDSKKNYHRTFLNLPQSTTEISRIATVTNLLCNLRFKDEQLRASHIEVVEEERKVLDIEYGENQRAATFKFTEHGKAYDLEINYDLNGNPTSIKCEGIGKIAIIRTAQGNVETLKTTPSDEQSSETETLTKIMDVFKRAMALRDIPGENGE